MTNYCNNTLTVVSYDDDQQGRFWRDAKGQKCELSFGSLIPMPDDLDRGDQIEWIGENWGTVMYEDMSFGFHRRNLYIAECH